MTKTVREFNAAGPCIQLGEFVKFTPRGQVVFQNRHGKTERRGGFSVDSGLIHTIACPSCRDHSETQYPNGYEN